MAGEVPDAGRPERGISDRDGGRVRDLGPRVLERRRAPLPGRPCPRPRRGPDHGRDPARDLFHPRVQHLSRPVPPGALRARRPSDQLERDDRVRGRGDPRDRVRARSRSVPARPRLPQREPRAPRAVRALHGGLDDLPPVRCRIHRTRAGAVRPPPRDGVQSSQGPPPRDSRRRAHPALRALLRVGRRPSRRERRGVDLPVRTGRPRVPPPARPRPHGRGLDGPVQLREPRDERPRGGARARLPPRRREGPETRGRGVLLHRMGARELSVHHPGLDLHERVRGGVPLEARPEGERPRWALPIPRGPRSRGRRRDCRGPRR